jgi:hypothetical protein
VERKQLRWRENWGCEIEIETNACIFIDGLGELCVGGIR